MFQRFFPGCAETLGDREVVVVCNTAQVGRDGHIFEPSGAQLDNYRSNPIFLWQHDVTKPVAIATAIGVRGDVLAASVQFAPAGVSPIADEICNLVKCGVVSGVSVGIEPIETEPLDPRNPRGGQRVLAWELLECSFCSIPIDVGAGVVARSMRSRASAIAALRGLPVVPRAGIERAALAFRRQYQPLPLIERLAAVRRLRPKEPTFTGDVAGWTHAMAAFLEHRTLAASSARRDDRARRLAELRALTRR